MFLLSAKSLHIVMKHNRYNILSWFYQVNEKEEVGFYLKEKER